MFSSQRPRGHKLEVEHGTKRRKEAKLDRVDRDRDRGWSPTPGDVLAPGHGDELLDLCGRELLEGALGFRKIKKVVFRDRRRKKKRIVEEKLLKKVKELEEEKAEGEKEEEEEEEEKGI